MRDGASHIVLLTRVFDKSQGDVLELGTGYFSTLLLHWLATVAKRRVVSYETQKHWYERARRWQSEFHDIVFCRNLTRPISISVTGHGLHRPRPEQPPSD